MVTAERISVDQKNNVVAALPIPRHQKRVRAFIGTTGGYRCFIRSFTEREKPLTLPTNKYVRFKWTLDHDQILHNFKSALIVALVLAYPDHSLPFLFDTDASDTATGAVQGQVQKDMERVIAYSKRISKEAINYCATRNELLVITEGIKDFRPYLWGRRFTAQTDHASLVWLLMS